MKKTTRAKKGRRSTPPSRSLEDLLGLSLSREHAYLAGHQGALFDELNRSLNVSEGTNRRKPEEMPVLPNGNLDARVQPDDPVTMPKWAFDAVYDLVMDAMIAGTKGRGRHARWWRQYRDDLIHWHRYALVRQAIDESRAKWPPGQPDVYEVVSSELAGTAFAAEATGIKYSVEEVARALKSGQQARFYRSTAAAYYDFLLNTPGPTIIQVYGALLVKSPI